MLLDIIDEKVLLNKGSDMSKDQRFNSETLKRDYVNLYKYLEQYILPLCASIKDEIQSIDQVRSGFISSVNRYLFVQMR